MVGALLASVLHRDLTPEEDGALGWAVTQLATAAHAQPTLADLAGLLADPGPEIAGRVRVSRSEEHTSELQSLMRISYAVFCLKNNRNIKQNRTTLRRKN